MMGSQGHTWNGTGRLPLLNQAGLFILIVLGIVYLAQRITADRATDRQTDDHAQDDQS